MIAAILLSAASPDPMILTFGIGNQSCAAAWRSQNEQASLNWIGGFWTALNLERSAQVGGRTDFDGISGEIKLACQQHPSMTLATVTFQTYERMASTR